MNCRTLKAGRHVTADSASVACEQFDLKHLSSSTNTHLRNLATWY